MTLKGLIMDDDGHDFDFPTGRAIAEIHGWMVTFAGWAGLPAADPRRMAYDKMAREQNRLLERFTS